MGSGREQQRGSSFDDRGEYTENWTTSDLTKSEGLSMSNDANEGETGYQETAGGIKRLRRENTHSQTHRKDLHLIWEGAETNELPHRLVPSPSTPPARCVIQWNDVRGQGAQTHRKHSVNSNHLLSTSVHVSEWVSEWTGSFQNRRWL